MAGFKPKNSGKTNGDGNFEQRNFPTPKNGARKARVSLIVDLGVQAREDFEDPVTKELKPQKPCQQVVVFADLVQDVVDYGGPIGKAQYRLLLNKAFAGVVQGVNFTAVPPKDAKGNMIAGKEWGFHPANLLTKLAKAVGKPEVITSMDISELLDMPFVADVEVIEKDSEKKDKDGNPIIYRNVNFKGASKVGMHCTGEFDDDGNEVEVEDAVAPLKQPALCITFDNATADVIKFIRPNLIKMIKLAEDYAGSQMQAAIEEFEKTQSNKPANNDTDTDDTPADTPKEKPVAKKPVAKKVAVKAPVDTSDMDDDIPFN